jgi:hypothetical protein
MADATAGETSELLRSWEWYGEAVKWFVAIAAAVMAFGFDQAAHRSLDGWLFWAYLVATALLAAAAVAGLFSYLQLLGFANLREKKNPTQKEKDKTDRHLARMGTAYMAMVGLLGAGFVASAVWWVAASLPSVVGVQTPPPELIVPAPGEPPLLLRKGAADEVLTRDASGAYTWQKFQAPTTARSGP